MLATSAGGSLFAFIVYVYVIGFVISIAMSRVSRVRSGSTGLRGAIRPRKRQARGDLRTALIWPVSAYRYVQGRSSGQQPVAPDAPDPGLGTNSPSGGPPAGSEGLEIRKYGLIDEADS